MKFTVKTLFALIGAVLALLMLLLPFATVSAYGESDSANGFSVLFNAGDAEGLCVPFFVWLAFLGGLAGIVLLFLGKGGKIAGAVFLACGIAEMLYIVTFESMSLLGMSIHVGFGAWLALIFNLAAGVFALFGDRFAFLGKVKVDQVTSKLDSASAAFQKTADSVTSSVKAGVQAAAANRASAQERTCPSCGAKVDSESKFCLACGAKLEQPAPETPEAPAEQFCSGCGAKVEPGSKFCPNCGQPC